MAAIPVHWGGEVLISRAVSPRLGSPGEIRDGLGHPRPAPRARDHSPITRILTHPITLGTKRVGD